MQRRFLLSDSVFPLVCFFRVAVITLEPLPPLSPYVRFSRVTPDKVLPILSVVMAANASTLPEGVDPSTTSNS
jgi:hypothetical protein